MIGKATIPVGEMAKANLETLFPGLEPDEYKALREGKPLPVRVAPQPPDIASEIRRLQTFIFRLLTSKVNGPLPKVSCILVFGKKERLRMARTSVNQFVAQTYPNKELIIVNSADTPVTNREHPAVTEISSKSTTVGGMRNDGLAVAKGDYIRPCWDDDDHYDPQLLAYQVATGRAAYGASLLSHQVRVNVAGVTGYVHHQPEGIPNTMLVRNDAGNRFELVDHDDDVLFWTRHYSTNTHVVDNGMFPFNALNIAVYHGNNILPVEEFMDGRTGSGRWELSMDQMNYLATALRPRGLVLAQQTAPVESSNG